MPDGLDGRPRVLVVDDEKAIREMLAEFLGMEGYAVRTAEDGLAAVGHLQREQFDLVISDLKMPRMGGIALLEEIGKAAPSTVTVIMTGFGTVETAIDAMKRGAYDYVLKPFKLDEVVHVLNRGLEKQRMAAENMRLREAVSLYKVSEAIAASLNLDQVLETVADSSIHELSADLASTWLDDGEGGFFERQHLLGADAPKDIELGQIDPRAVLEHLRAENQLLEQGPAGAKYFSKPPAIPLVSLLVVQVHAGNEGMQELDGVQNVAPVSGMLLEHLVLVDGELAGLVQVEHAADLADVVHQRALPHDLDLIRREAQALRQDDGVAGHAVGVAGSVAVHLVDGLGEALYRLLEGGLQVFV